MVMSQLSRPSLKLLSSSVWRLILNTVLFLFAEVV